MAMVYFEVKDTGIGISKEAIANLFQSFNQADATTTRKYGGTGLGLAISKEIVKMMGGQISVESLCGEGTIFKFNVLFKIVRRNIKQEFEFGDLDGKNLLVVDDNNSNRLIIRSYLQNSGINITDAIDAGTAIATIVTNAEKKNKLDVAIIDYQMPGMNGYDLALAIKNMYLAKDIKLIMLTSVAQKGDCSIAKENGFVGYLTKPIRKSELN